jgi:PleD family two-component response regulator
VTETDLLIAVVDDEEPVRTALMRLMRSAGLSLETFGSGAEFLESLETRLPDCVVLNLHMPHMDGFKRAGTSGPEMRSASCHHCYRPPFSEGPRAGHGGRRISFPS